MPNFTPKRPSVPASSLSAEGKLGRIKPDVLNVSNGYGSTSHGLLKRVLYGMTNKKGTPIYKTLMKCGQFTGRKGTSITYTGMANKKVFKGGVVRCKNPECPNCSGTVIAKEVKRLKKALTAIKQDGGDLAFITITMKPTKDPTKGIKAMTELKKKLDKALRNFDRNKVEGNKGLSYITIERTHSSKFAHRDEYGTKSLPYAYLHTHLHMAVGWMGVDNQPIDRLKKITKRFFNDCKNGLSSNIDEASTDDNKLTAAGQTAGWKVDYVDDDKGIATYLNKVADQSNQLALEMSVESSKKGIGYGLFTVLKLLDKNRDNNLLNAHKKNIRAWFKEMFGKSRSTMHNVDYWEDRFEEQQKVLIENWCTRKSIHLVDHRQAFNMVSMAWEGIPEVWLEDELEPVIITKEMRDAETVAFIETVDVRLYNYFHLRGWESTLEHLFRRYWFDEQEELCYNAYKEVNFGYTVEGVLGLKDLLNSRGLLMGSRWLKNY